MIRKAKKQRINDTINNVMDSKTWWRGLRELSGMAQPKPQQDRHLIDGEWMSSQRLCEDLNNYFTGIGGSCLPTSHQSDSTSSCSAPTIVHIGQVKQRLQSLDVRKSAHSDDFPAWISQECAEDVCIPLTNIINAIFHQRKFPGLWKKAEVLPLPKVKNVTTLSEHRPISLLWHCGKIAETFIMDRYKHEVLPKIKVDQFAYQQHKGTTDALLWAIDDWTAILDNKSNAAVQVLFKDFSKAFDLMQPSLLLDTLKSMEVSDEVRDLCQSFMSDREQCVVLNGKRSTYAQKTVGVPQGTISGPLFWIAFVNSYSITNGQAIKYADDISCYRCITKRSLNETNETIKEWTEYGIGWCESNGMRLNLAKTKAMNIALRKPVTTEVCVVKNTPIEEVSSFKFLGLYVDNQLNFKTHVDITVKKCRARLFGLLKLKRLGVDCDRLRSFYLANIRSVLAYAAPAFISILAKCDVEKLESVQRHATRIMMPELDSYSERREQLRIPSVRSHLFDTAVAHHRSVADNPNHVLHSKLPPLQSAVGRHSTRLADNRVRRANTVLRANSFFQKFS